LCGLKRVVSSLRSAAAAALGRPVPAIVLLAVHIPVIPLEHWVFLEQPLGQQVLGNHAGKAAVDRNEQSTLAHYRGQGEGGVRQ
jgi:hypothetical protein